MEWEAEYLKRVGNNVRKYRDGIGFSQQDLAYEADTAKSTILRIENGRHNPTITMLQKIANALGVDVCDLLKSAG